MDSQDQERPPVYYQIISHDGCGYYCKSCKSYTDWYPDGPQGWDGPITGYKCACGSDAFVPVRYVAEYVPRVPDGDHWDSCDFSILINQIRDYFDGKLWLMAGQKNVDVQRDAADYRRWLAD